MTKEDGDSDEKGNDIGYEKGNEIENDVANAPTHTLQTAHIYIRMLLRCITV